MPQLIIISTDKQQFNDDADEAIGPDILQKAIYQPNQRERMLRMLNTSSYDFIHSNCCPTSGSH